MLTISVFGLGKLTLLNSNLPGEIHAYARICTKSLFFQDIPELSVGETNLSEFLQEDHEESS